ncbi:hypothetical protein HZB04_02455 [Candidatus Wolfebacteria bacterium]|nr:hypothetical protein [Candidatus Wolfebacteria bacterium]
MNSSAVLNLARMLGVDAPMLLNLDQKMSQATGKSGTLDFIFKENQKLVNEAFLKINGEKNADAFHVLGILRKTIFNHEIKFKNFLEKISGETVFEKLAVLAKKMVKFKKGYFLKKENIKKILLSRPPRHLMEYLGYRDINSLVEKEDLTECFSALRFIESNDWMHETFKEVYSNFTERDFEKREIEVKVLGKKWQEIAEKFVAKKHHNVSHLKEFGVIFLNPIAENIPGKFLRDFLLFLHYFHEIGFYSKLFKNCFDSQDFSEHFQSLLRGDVMGKSKIQKSEIAEWLIVQRYLNKENPNDQRLFMPRVNPESIHWLRGERDFAEYFKKNGEEDLAMWSDLGWVGAFFKRGDSEEFLSFDIEDNAMSVVSFMEGRGLEQFFTYHQKEAMWTRIFQKYAGGEENMERLLIENFDKGVIRF